MDGKQRKEDVNSVLRFLISEILNEAAVKTGATGVIPISQRQHSRHKKQCAAIVTNHKTHQSFPSQNMSSKEEILAARGAKKLAKQKAKKKDSKDITEITKVNPQKEENPAGSSIKEDSTNSSNSKDEVDRAADKGIKISSSELSKEQIKAERGAKLFAKQTKKNGTADSGAVNQDLTVKDVVETLKDIVNVAKEMKDVSAKVNAMDLEPGKKTAETGKSKAELRAERRAKQEAQRAAKQAATTQKTNKPKESTGTSEVKEEKPVNQKTLDKPKVKLQKTSTENWFQQLPSEKDKETLKNIPLNSNLHPAIIKLGVQLATRVVTGSNARCVALLDALKKMVRDYALPAKTEFSRGLEAHLAASLDYLWKMRPPAASQTNAVKFFRYHLTQLPNNVDEFDAKKRLQEEIERYIREQIDMAGEAISMAVRNKISPGDNILTYGCSSLIERIFREAWQVGVKFRAILVGARGARHAEMLRRLRAIGLPCAVADVTALSFVMPTVNKAIIGASALLVDGSVVGAAGTAQVALSARAHNVPLLIAAETHKFSASVRAAALDYTELGDPDDLIDKTDENCPLKDWRTNPNLTLLNLTYDVTPPSLVTAVVTELAILPCTSAPVVLRFKLSEYGI